MTYNYNLTLTEDELRILKSSLPGVRNRLCENLKRVDPRNDWGEFAKNPDPTVFTDYVNLKENLRDLDKIIEQVDVMTEDWPY
jgi:hypothetical protein